MAYMGCVTDSIKSIVLEPETKLQERFPADKQREHWVKA